MTYTPKSKISFNTTSGGDLIVALTKKPYIGDYMEFSGGKLYKGNNSQNIEVELLPLTTLTPTNRIGDDPDSKTYSNLRPPTKKSLSKYKQVPSTKPFPTEKDYKIGYFIRYFAKKVNQQFGFIEIDLKTYTSLDTQKKEYDHNLYMVGTITWSLINTLSIINSKQIQVLERSVPLISTLFSNPIEHGKIRIPPRSFV